MNFIITTLETCDLIVITGRIDSYTSPSIEDALKALIADGHHKLVINLADVTYLSSSGMLMLINAQKQCQRHPNGKIILTNVSDRIFSSLEIAGFHQFFEFFNDVSAALKGFQ